MNQATNKERLLCAGLGKSSGAFAFSLNFWLHLFWREKVENKLTQRMIKLRDSLQSDLYIYSARDDIKHSKPFLKI